MSEQTVLKVSDIRKTYTAGGSMWQRLLTGQKETHLRALDGVDLDLRRGEILALVGESGSGKSTLAKILVGGTGATSGEIVYEGAPMPATRDKAMARRIQMVFQDPYSSLNPRMTVRAMLSELLRVHDVVPRAEVDAECLRLMNVVGLDESALDAYPSQFSGGQRQRIAIARAIAPRPDVLIADEPVSALDVSVQATILDLLASLRDELGLTILFVAHNLAVVQHLCQRVAVMYLGRIVEVGETADVFADPRHPYTRGLIASIPRMSPVSINEDVVPEGEPPSPYSVPTGCRFNPRCTYAVDECRSTDPALIPVGAVRVRSGATAVASPEARPGAARGADASTHLSACLRAEALADIT